MTSARPCGGSERRPASVASRSTASQSASVPSTTSRIPRARAGAATAPAAASRPIQTPRLSRGATSSPAPIATRPAASARATSRAAIGLVAVVRRDGDDALAALLAEDDRARRAGVERVVLADADAGAGAEAGAALADDDLAAADGLAGERLDAEALCVGVAPVARGAEALLVCHYPLTSVI